MKNNKITFITALLTYIFINAIFLSLIKKEEKNIEPIITRDTVYLEKDTVYCFIDKQKDFDWDKFVQALIYVESKGNKNAIGTKDDVGVLQIRHTIVDDCNRIVGYEKYSLNDRTDSLLSIEMFNVIQDYYNPKKDFNYALKIWNPQSSFSYHHKVAKQYNKLLI